MKLVNIKKEKDKYPFGIYNKTQKKKMIISTSIFMIVICIMLYVFFNIFEGIFDLLMLLFMTFFAFIGTLSITIRHDPIRRANQKFLETSNLDDFEKVVFEALKEPLHSESRAYLLLLYVNYLSLYDLDKALEMFTNIKKPTSMFVRSLYDVIEIICCFNDEYFEEAVKLIDQFKNRYPKYKAYINQIERIKIFKCTNEEVKDIEKSFPINTKQKFINYNNASILMAYYESRNNLDQAKIYAKFLVNNAKHLTYTYNEALKLLEKE